MLYCPRCNREYNEGVQRFCIHDGGRLMPKTAERGPAGGVFASLVGKASTPEDGDEILSIPKFVPVAKPADRLPDGPIGKPPERPVEQQAEIQIERPSEPAVEKPKAPSFIEELSARENELFSEDKPSKQISIDELGSFQAPLGDRKRNPSGRLALNWENPNVLLGHTVRGRYFIEQRVSIDDVCITYLAQDRAANNKRVVFKVLAAGSEYIENTAEERVGLSHLNHPHIVKILDSGEMPEGMPFAVFEYVEGRSLREMLDSGDPFTPIEAARVTKQVSEALSSAKQNGILHYDVRPQKIILTEGTQIAKVTDFALAKGYKAPSVRKIKDVAYQSPEQLQGRELTAASESYSLAAIAYEMLTGRLPFNFESMRELVDAQKRGLTSKPHVILPNLPAEVDEIFTRALAFDPDKRYQKARDLGDALYNAISSVPAVAAPPADADDEDILGLDTKPLPKVETVAPPPAPKKEAAAAAADAETNKITKLQTPPEQAWERHVQEPSGLSKWAIATICLLGLVGIGTAVFLYINYFSGQPQTAQNQENANVQTSPLAVEPQNPAAPPAPAVEDDPPPRVITPPENSTRFQNVKEGLSPVLLKNFRGFSLYYPNDWKKNPSDANFIDVSKSGENGLPVEQMLVSWYESKGTFSYDSPGFAKLADAINKKWSTLIADYKPMSQGPQVLNNARQVYEIKFQGSSDKGDKVTIWGRTLFVPPGKFGFKNGLLVTMLATSNSPDVHGVDDVGNKGQLKEILYSLEPDPLN
jgi:serine/threonine protein kinase